ncbi:hypothetical protein Efla_006070 [Eimeria flavescens]
MQLPDSALSGLHPLCLLVSSGRGVDERQVECSFEVPVCELLTKLLPAGGSPKGIRQKQTSGGHLGVKPVFTLATEDGVLLDRSKSLLACGIKPPLHQQQQQNQQQEFEQGTLPALSLPQLDSPQPAHPPRLFLTPQPLPPPLRISVVQARDGKADIVEMNSWEKVSYLESWAEKRFASLVLSSRNISSGSSICPILPGSNGKGFVLVFLGAPLNSSKTLEESGIQQQDTVYIHFAVDAPLTLPPSTKPARPASAAVAHA